MSENSWCGWFGFEEIQEFHASGKCGYSQDSRLVCCSLFMVSAR